MKTKYKCPFTEDWIIIEGYPESYYVLRGFQDPTDEGKIVVHRNNQLIPLLNALTGDQLTIQDTNV